MSHHNYASDREGSFKKQHPYLGQCPNRGGGSDRIPTSLTDLAK